MVARARELNPGIAFQQGDMKALDLPDGHFAGIAAFYSLIHIAPSEIPATLRELHRVLRPDGLLLAAFHIGDDTLHLDEWWGLPVSVDFHFFQPDQLRGWLESAGFEFEEAIEREPYPDVEHASRRGYLFARK
jgi:SAM-dependent methyltransferase